MCLVNSIDQRQLRQAEVSKVDTHDWQPGQASLSLQATTEKWDPLDIPEEEAIPITKVQEDLPPPKPKDPPVIEITEDDSPEPEDEIETTETSLDDIVEVDDIIEVPVLTTCR